MRTITRVGFGALAAAAMLACLLSAQTAQAQGPICHWPATVPSEFIASITARLTITPSPGPDLCESIAKAEVKGCNKAVKLAASCNNILNGADATAKDADCSTLPDSSAQKACSDSVKAGLDALNTTVKDASASGAQACLDLQPNIYSLCIGGT